MRDALSIQPESGSLQYLTASSKTCTILTIVEAFVMGKLFETVRQLVAEQKYIVGQHASERLEERGIMEWQAAAGMEEAELLA